MVDIKSSENIYNKHPEKKNENETYSYVEKQEKERSIVFSDRVDCIVGIYNTIFLHRQENKYFVTDNKSVNICVCVYRQKKYNSI